jgi:hypothetical protein
MVSYKNKSNINISCKNTEISRIHKSIQFTLIIKNSYLDLK